MKIIKGDLIKLALEGNFDVIAHGCNCMCTMGAGIAVPMQKEFGCNEGNLFKMERKKFKGDMNKLGTIEYELYALGEYEGDLGKGLEASPYMCKNVEWDEGDLYVVNAYTQYNYGRNHKDGTGKPIDYAALELCMKKINHTFKHKKLGLPWIGCGLAGGDKQIVAEIFERCLTDVKLTIVEL